MFSPTLAFGTDRDPKSGLLAFKLSASKNIDQHPNQLVTFVFIFRFTKKKKTISK